MDQKDYGLLDIVKIPFKCSRIYTSLIALQKIIDGLIPSLQVLAIANFLNTSMEIVNGKRSINEIFLPIVFIVVLVGYQWISEKLIEFIVIKLEIKLREDFEVRITRKIAGLKYNYIENSDTWDLISRVSKEPEIQVLYSYVDLLSVLSLIIRIVGIISILLVQVWWAAIIILCMCAPLIVLALKGGKTSYKADTAVSKNERKYKYLEEVLIGREGVLERSLFGYTHEINEKWIEEYEITRKIRFKVALKNHIKLKSASLITAIISILVIVVLVKPVLNRELSIGMFISISNGLISLIQMMSWKLTYYIKNLSKNMEYLKDLSGFLKLEETEGAKDLPSKEKIKVESIEFRNVYFKYPGTMEYILKGLSFKVENGLHYAFVGSNGSGKTTIIKLLTGLYETFEGDILINKKSVREYKQSELKSLYSVIYQDFAKYYISFQDNIFLGDTNSLNKHEKSERMHRAIGIMNLEETIENLPKGENTYLGRIKSGGVDLSGGQWQRVAMARSIFSSSPIRILDEPTAALDPISESRLYEEFENISKGDTTIFISHRLGSTKIAQKIFVIENGEIVEAGSHNELMKLQGLYANMYESQRSWYL